MHYERTRVQRPLHNKGRLLYQGVLVYGREIALVVLSVSTLFIVVSLATYSPTDPSWLTYTNAMQPLHNMAGFAGSCCASLLYWWWGRLAWMWPLIGLYGIWCLMFRHRLAHEWDRVIAFLCLPLCATVLAHYYGGIVYGGAVGEYLYQLMVTRLDHVSLCAIAGVSVLIAFTIITRASYIIVIHKMAEGAMMLWRQRAGVTRPLMVFIRYSWYGIQYAISGIYHWIDHMVYGRALYDEGESLFEFESQQALDPAEKHIHRDDFWQQYLGAREHGDITTHTVEALNEVAPTPMPDTLSVATVSPKPSLVTKAKRLVSLPRIAQFFKTPSTVAQAQQSDEHAAQARMLEEKLRHFGIQGTVTAIRPGPIVTMFEYAPGIETKLSKITALEDDLALALQAMSIRIIAPIPGTSVVGFEVANRHRSPVLFAEIIQSPEFAQSSATLPIILGKDTVGRVMVVDMTAMPHLLIAGSTGSGKSVALHALLVSLLCRKSPDELKLILIDPKRLEFSIYADIPHLLFPIVTQARNAIPVLTWAVQEMERRYTYMATCGVRTIAEYNNRVKDAKNSEEQPLPYIVVVIDELADLMLTAGRQIEELITRLSQMARAAGIHLIVATQRPSVDVVTGLIKANLPSRIALRVASKIDSRTILDTAGAEKLLGQGDMLYMPSGSANATRIHGAYITNEDSMRIAHHWRSQMAVEYLNLDECFEQGADAVHESDPLYNDVLKYLDEVDAVSISLLQRRFKIGYNRSARIIDMLEAQGRIVAAQGSKVRKVIR